MCYSRRDRHHRHQTHDSRRTPGPPPDPDVRVADADREHAITLLGDHAAAGRLSAEELDERSDRVLAARTRGELDEPFADLPHARARAGGARSSRAMRDRYVRAKLSLVAAGGALWAAVALLHHVA